MKKGITFLIAVFSIISAQAQFELGGELGGGINVFTGTDRITSPDGMGYLNFFVSYRRLEHADIIVGGGIDFTTYGVKVIDNRQSIFGNKDGVTSEFSMGLDLNLLYSHYLIRDGNFVLTSMGGYQLSYQGGISEPYWKHSLIVGTGFGYYMLRLNLYYHINLNSIPIGGDYPDANGGIKPFYGRNHSVSLSVMIVLGRPQY